MPLQPVQYIGSRELHRDLPKVLDTLGNADARVVLTVHSKPRAVLIGAKAFVDLLQSSSAADQMLARQLGALVQGLSDSAEPSSTG